MRAKRKIDPKKGSDTTIVKKEATDPKFSTDKAHNDFYRVKALKKLDSSDKKLYDSLKQGKSQADADAIIALRGGTPAREPEAKKAPVRVVMKSDVASGPTRKPEGYNYKKNKPASGSITAKRRKK